MEITKIKFELESVAPILFDRYSGINDQNDEEAKKNAIHKLYLNPEGIICIPSACLKASIRCAASEIGKKLESKKRRQAVRAGLFFDDEFIVALPEKKEPDGTHAEIVSRQTGSKITRVVGYRPFLKDWKLSTTATLYALTSEFLRQAIELAGFKFALCGHRPEYGRFILTNLEVV